MKRNRTVIMDITERCNLRGRPEAGWRIPVELDVPEQRRPELTRLEVQFAPTLVGAMLDALPYTLNYPYGCTEQTLNRFLPTVITQKIILEMGIDLKAVREKQTNLNAGEIGEDVEVGLKTLAELLARGPAPRTAIV